MHLMRHYPHGRPPGIFEGLKAVDSDIAALEDQLEELLAAAKKPSAYAKCIRARSRKGPVGKMRWPECLGQRRFSAQRYGANATIWTDLLAIPVTTGVATRLNVPGGASPVAGGTSMRPLQRVED